MANTELDDKQREIKIAHIQVVYYIILFSFISIVASTTAYSIVNYVRKDNERTRHLICQVVDKVQLQVADCGGK